VYKKINLVLLDLDGVLVDSKKNMYLSWKKVQEKFQLKIPFSYYFKHIGMPFEKILQKLLIKNNLSQIYKTYQLESIKQTKKIKLYPRIKKTLKNFKKKKIKLGIVTSKDKNRTKKLIKKLKIDVKLVISPSKRLRGKPYPDQLLKAIKLAKVEPSKTIYVGDMLVDYKAANRAKINYIHAAYGYGKKLSYYKYSIKKFDDLLKIVK